MKWTIKMSYKILVDLSHGEKIEFPERLGGKESGVDCYDRVRFLPPEKDLSLTVNPQSQAPSDSS